MKNILAKLFGGVGGSIAEKISGIIDKHTFSKVERAQFEKEMEENQSTKRRASIFAKEQIELLKDHADL